MNGLGLKLFAIIAMTLDHIGAVFFPEQLWLRMIGRIAFPIYCFLLVEGYRHTKSIRKYIFRLFICAVVSEVPFNLVFFGSVFYPGSQNVFWTLLIGLLSIWLSDYVNSRAGGSAFRLGYAAYAAGCILALLIKPDYGYFGILLIFVFYELGYSKAAMFAGALFLFFMMNKIQLFGLFAFGLIFIYNGKRGYSGRALSRAFYLFYPAHLLAVYCIERFIDYVP